MSVDVDKLNAIINALALDGELSPADNDYLLDYLQNENNDEWTARDLIRIRRGVQADLSNITLLEGEIAYTTDTKRLYVGGQVGYTRYLDTSDLLNLNNHINNVDDRTTILENETQQLIQDTMDLDTRVNNLEQSQVPLTRNVTVTTLIPQGFTTTGQWNKLLDLEVVDGNVSMFDEATNEFVVTRTGVYAFNVTYALENYFSGRLLGGLFVNGNTTANDIFYDNTFLGDGTGFDVNFVSVTGCIVLNLNEGDRIHFSIYNTIVCNGLPDVPNVKLSMVQLV